MSIVDVTSVESPMEVDWDSCSSQVRELSPLNPEYRELVLRLWADTLGDPGPRELQQRGYRYLVSLFYAMPKRAYLDGKPMSLEFQDLATFCRYVGPRPTSKHSLHRMDNAVGYCIGNVEWADKRKQAEVRRTAQHHVHLGRRLSDRQLTELLATKGCAVTVATIKKFRQRLTRKGITPTEITGMIFKKHGVPYESSKDPVEGWDFPPEFRDKLTHAYQSFRRANETRLEYYVRWLQETEAKYTRLRDDPLTSSAQKTELSDAQYRYHCLAEWARRDLKVLHQQKVDAVIEEIVPGWPEAALPSVHVAKEAPGSKPLPMAAAPASQPSKPTTSPEELELLDRAFLTELAGGKSCAQAALALIAQGKLITP
jgi:hypothetical protein